MQDVKYGFTGQTVMVLTVDPGDRAMQIVNEQRKILNTAKQDAERLGSKDQMTITVIIFDIFLILVHPTS